MGSRDRDVVPPTERELRLAAEWSRVARLIHASIQSRIDFDPDTINDPLARYAPLRVLLSDTYIAELYACGERESAEELRRTQRKKYAGLLARLSAEARKHQKERLRHMDQAASWTAYGEVFRQEWFIRLVIARLYLALWMHGVSFPGAVWMACNACKNLRRLFPPSGVVPIRT
jgi:hypothetical protein